MKRWTFAVALASMVFCHSVVMAQNDLNINPGGLFKLSLSGVTLQVLTTTPHKIYPNAGIQILTPGYTVTGDVHLNKNGFSLFFASDTIPAFLNFVGPAGTVEFRLCLDRASSVCSCENQTISLPPNSRITIN